MAKLYWLHHNYLVMGPDQKKKAVILKHNFPVNQSVWYKNYNTYLAA